MPRLKRPDPTQLPLLPPHPTTHPWPETQPLDHHAVEAALWHANGNLHKAASLLGTNPARLAYLVQRVPYLADSRQRAADLLVDKAEATLLDALDADDPIRNDSTARYVIDKKGANRGWGKDGGVALSFGTAGVPAADGALTIRWNIPAKE